MALVMHDVEVGSAPLGSAPSTRASSVSFHELTMTVATGPTTKTLLNKVHSTVDASSLTCIMGPSGAGKSSLLNVIAGRIASTKTLTIIGDVLIGGEKIDPVKYKQNIAYVMQDDAITPTSTVREALRFSAALRRGLNETPAEIEALVTSMISDLGLESCADTFVGGELIKGISGGERKRTSIGVELITDPSLVFLDEPTSGLDSYSAFKIVELLKSLSHSGRCTVMCTIHQPSSEVFLLFDNCILLKSGHITYTGPVTAMGTHFNACGYPVPANTNLADHAMFVVQQAAVDELQKKGMLMPDAAPLTTTPPVMADPKPARTTGGATQFVWLMHRELQATKRDKGALIGRFGITIFLNTLFGIIFYGAGNKDDTVGSNFGDHFGALTMIAISSMFGSAQPVLIAFPAQRPIFLREYATGTYSVIPYFFSKLFFELPMSLLQAAVQWLVVYFMIQFQANYFSLMLSSFAIASAAASVAALLGSVVADIKTATEMLPLVLVPQLLFAGFFIKTENIPAFIRWAEYLCSLKYGMNLLLIVEFSGDACKKGGAATVAQCDALLDANGVYLDQTWVYIAVLFSLFVGFRVWGAYMLMTKAKTVF